MLIAPKHTLISIEGNIGSGKSTLLKLISEKYTGFDFVQEPVNEWQCISGNPNLNLLGEFYADPNRWAYTMQVYAFYSRLRHWKRILDQEQQGGRMILSERSIQADKNIFAVNGFKNGLINELEYALYNNFYEWLGSNYNNHQKVNEIFGKSIEKQVIIYLKVDPKISYVRLQKRARSEEKNSIKLEYLQQIHDRHEEWLSSNKDIHILTIDGDKEFESDQDRTDAIFNSIDNFFHSLKII